MIISKAKALSQLRDSLHPYYTLRQFDQLLREAYGPDYGLKQFVAELEEQDCLKILPNLASVFLLTTNNWYSG